MVMLQLRQIAPGGTLTAARAHVLLLGEAGYYVDTDGTRRFTIGDGVRNLGQFIDAGETFDVRGGLSILSGTGVPSDSVGRNGEQYYDRTSKTMWGPKADGTWVGTSQGSIAPATSDHGLLDGLADDDHGQYHTEGRANTWLATKSLDAVVDSATRLAMTSAERTKLTGVETGATADQSAAEILAALLTVDGAGSGLDADLLDGSSSAAFATAAQGATADTAVQPGDNITDLDGTANRVLYVDSAGDVTELALGADGTYLRSNGATSAPSFGTPAGSGDVSKVGTPADNQVAVWTGDGTLEGASGLTYDGSTLSVTGNFAPTGTVDGRYVAADGTKLDGVEALADVTDATNVNAAGAVMESDFNANTILAATTDNTPAAVTVAEQTLVGRITGGAIAALSIAQILTLLGLDGAANVQTATWTIGATYNPNDVVVHDDSLYLQNSGTTSTGDDPSSGAPWLLLCRGITSAERSKLAAIEALADVTDATNVAAAGAVMVSAISDDETLADEATNQTVSERAIKAYVDANAGGGSVDAGLLTEGPIAREITGTFEVVGATGAGGVGTAALANGRILALPHRFPGTGTFSPASISCEATTGAGSTNVRLHIWDATGANGGPGASLYMSASIDSAGSGFKTANTSMPTLTRGVWYWFGVSSDGAPTVRTLSTSACRTLRGDTSLPTGPRSSLLRNGTTFGTPPDPWGAFASHLSAANPPVIIVEYA